MTAGGEDSVAEHVRAEYVSTHSYLDAILSRINTAEVDMATMMMMMMIMMIMMMMMMRAGGHHDH